MNEDLLQAVTDRLKAIAVGSARLEARLLIEAAAGDAALCETFMTRRLAGEPVDRIVGRRGFWSLDLIVTSNTLSPRPDSETIIEAALDHVRQAGKSGKPLRILDLGTGTGALLLALLTELPNATGIGVDLSPAAMEVAGQNARHNGLQDRASFRCGSWSEGLSGTFDIIVSNPPYIPTADIAGLETEVREHDPILALDGGADGLVCYRQIFPGTADLLTPDGIAIFEFGQGQGPAIKAIAEESGLAFSKFCNDLGGITRIIILNKM